MIKMNVLEFVLVAFLEIVILLLRDPCLALNEIVTLLMLLLNFLPPDLIEILEFLWHLIDGMVVLWISC